MFSSSVSITCTYQSICFQCCNHRMRMCKHNQSTCGFMISLSFEWNTQDIHITTNTYHPPMQVACLWWSVQLCSGPKDGPNKSNATWWWRDILSCVNVAKEVYKCKTIGSMKKKWGHAQATPVGNFDSARHYFLVVLHVCCMCDVRHEILWISWICLWKTWYVGQVGPLAWNQLTLDVW